MELKNKYVILEKLSGERYRADMPVGDRSIQGYCLELPEVGYQFFLYNCIKDVEVMGAIIPCHDLPIAWTSRVEEIDLINNIIRTKNSIYKIEIKDDI
jgi:hypothetical protein